MSLRHILVPTDFSREAERAARLGRAIAQASDAELTLLHVQPLPGFATITVEPIYVSPDVFERLQGAQHEALEQRMQELTRDLGDGAELHTAFKRGEAVEGIVEYAAEADCDLIVVGSSGRGATRLLLGSVSEKVSRRAPCPVIIARGELDDQRGRFRHALVGIDYSQFSAPLVHLCASLLAPGGKLELFHAWDEPFLTSFDLDMGERAEYFKLVSAGRAEQVERLRKYAAELDVGDQKEIEVETSLEGGRPPAAILDRARESGADLIAVGAHAQEGAAEHLLGTVADRVLRHADVPVLLLPAGAL